MNKHLSNLIDSIFEKLKKKNSKRIFLDREEFKKFIYFLLKDN